jgi:8-oxo-dGTP diphosphatase
MKNKRQQIGALVILKNKDKYLFVRRGSKLKYEAGKWGFVGEKIEFGETPEEAAKRGVKEELNLDVDNFKLLGTLSDVWEREDEIKHVILIVFVSEVGNVTPTVTGELDDFKWLTVKEAKKLDMIKNSDKIMAKLEKLD